MSQIKWIPVPGKLVQVSVGNHGDVWGVNEGYGIFHYQGDGKWLCLDGKFKWVTIDTNGDVWALTDQGEPMSYNGHGGWDRVGSLTGMQVIASGGGDVWGLDNDFVLARLTDAGWVSVNDNTSYSGLSVADDGTLFVTSNGTVFVSHDQGASWSDTGGNDLVSVNAATNFYVYALDSSGNVFRWGSNSWESVNGNLKNISVNPAGEIWGVNSGMGIFTNTK